MKQLIFILSILLVLTVGHVLRDNQVPGGTGRRNIDVWVSEHFGGHKSAQVQNGGEPSAYGKYLEPVLHSAEHFFRAIFAKNQNELNRAADEYKTIGKGLHTNQHIYQHK